jgi:glycosyltransferase involved in cell wall biosynthesis
MVEEIQFSICVPNFNYRKYLELTCKSVLEQEYENYEIVIADNQSTDGSIEFIKEIASNHNIIRYVVNPSNFGFASNLERVTSLAKGKYLILLSSDDLMNRGALSAYEKLLQVTDKNCVVGSLVYKVDSDGKILEQCEPDARFWRESDIDTELSVKLGNRIYKVKAHEMLRRCLSTMGNPYYFLTVCYPTGLLEKVGGYGGGRMYGPDKWFNWKLFSEADTVYLIDGPLFSYRWHHQNQLALETSFGHLKYLVDEYRNAIEVTEKMIAKSGVTKQQVEKVFINRDIYRHGIGEFVKGKWVKSLRIFCFGLAVFPGKMLRNVFFVPYLMLLLTTPVGSMISSFFFRKK